MLGSGGGLVEILVVVLSTIAELVVIVGLGSSELLDKDCGDVPVTVIVEVGTPGHELEVTRMPIKLSPDA